MLNKAYSKLKDKGLNYSATTQNADQTHRRIRNHDCIIAVTDEQIVGTILYRNRSQRGGPPWYDHPDVAVFFQVAVHPDYQSHGIGGMLLDYVEQRALHEGASEIAADTAVQATALLDMYRRHGYRIVDYTYWPNANYRSAIFSKQLREEAPVTISKASCLRARWIAKLRQMKWQLMSQRKSPFATDDS